MSCPSSLNMKSIKLLPDSVNSQISDGSGNIKSLVQGNENAIGYISFSYVDDSVKSFTGLFLCVIKAIPS